jgi:hypothetical protein
MVTEDKCPICGGSGFIRMSPDMRSECRICDRTGSFSVYAAKVMSGEITRSDIMHAEEEAARYMSHFARWPISDLP